MSEFKRSKFDFLTLTLTAYAAHMAFWAGLAIIKALSE